MPVPRPCPVTGQRRKTTPRCSWPGRRLHPSSYQVRQLPHICISRCVICVRHRHQSRVRDRLPRGSPGPVPLGPLLLGSMLVPPPLRVRFPFQLRLQRLFGLLPAAVPRHGWSRRRTPLPLRRLERLAPQPRPPATPVGARGGRVAIRGTSPASTNARAAGPSVSMGPWVRQTSTAPSAAEAARKISAIAAGGY